jgi:hypothetical protein
MWCPPCPSQTALHRDAVNDRELSKTGFVVKYEGPDKLHARMVHEMAMWKEIVERAGLKKE